MSSSNVDHVAFQAEVDKSLQNFACDLQIPAYRECGKEMCQKVIQTLQKQVLILNQADEISFSISATGYGGSYAKDTDILPPDFTLVFRIKNENRGHHPVTTFPKAINGFKKILEEKSTPLNILPVPIETTKWSLRFWFVNGIKVDLLLATPIKNPEVIMTNLAKLATDKNRAMATLMRHYYNSSLVEHQVLFFLDQSDFTRNVIRLAKLWKSQCDFGNVTGVTTVVELIAIAGALEEEQRKPEKEWSIVRALIRVFEMIENLNTLKLAFHEANGILKRVKLEALTTRATVLVPQIVGLSEMLERKRMLVEPMNPYSDLLENFTDHTINKIMEYGKTMKERLIGLSQNRKYCVIDGTGGIVRILYENMFEPQPLNIGVGGGGATPTKMRLGLPTHVYLSLDHFQHRVQSRRRSSTGGGEIAEQPKFFDVNIRRPDITMRKENQRVLDLITMRMLGVVTCAGGGLGNLNGATSDEMLNIVKELLQNMLPSPPVDFAEVKSLPGERGDRVSIATLDDYHVTISMPYSCRETGEFCYGIRVSFKWGN